MSARARAALYMLPYRDLFQIENFMTQIKTIHLKVKPESHHWLNMAAREVNDVWNYCKGTPDKDGKWNTGVYCL